MGKRLHPIVRYNRFLAASRKTYHFNHRTAQQHYRTLKERLDRPPVARDLKAHPRIARQEAARAAGGRPRAAAGAAGGAAPAGQAPMFIEDMEFDFVDYEGDEDSYGEAET